MADRVINVALTRKPAPVRVEVVQYTTAPDIVFLLEDYTPTGSAQIYIDKPSGEEIYNNCTIEGNKVRFTPTTQCFAEVGENKAQLQLLDGNKMAVSFLITFIVEENIIDDDAVESQSEFTELQEAISTIGQYDQRIQDVQDNMDALNTQIHDDMAALDTDLTEDMAALQRNVNAQIANVNTEITNITNKTDKVIFASGMQSANFGDGANTSDTYHWGNATNKVGVGATVNGERHNLMARENALVLNKSTPTPAETKWQLSNLSGNIDMGAVNNMLPTGTQSGLYVGLGGYITTGSKTLRFVIPIPTVPKGKNIVANSVNVAIVARGINGYVGVHYVEESSTTDITFADPPRQVIENGTVTRDSLMGPTINYVTVSLINRSALNINIVFKQVLKREDYSTTYANNTPVSFDAQVSYTIA